MDPFEAFTDRHLQKLFDAKLNILKIEHKAKLETIQRESQTRIEVIKQESEHTVKNIEEESVYKMKLYKEYVTWKSQLEKSERSAKSASLQTEAEFRQDFEKEAMDTKREHAEEEHRIRIEHIKLNLLGGLNDQTLFGRNEGHSTGAEEEMGTETAGVDFGEEIESLDNASGSRSKLSLDKIEQLIADHLQPAIEMLQADTKNHVSYSMTEGLKVTQKIEDQISTHLGNGLGMLGDRFETEVKQLTSDLHEMSKSNDEHILAIGTAVDDLKRSSADGKMESDKCVEKILERVVYTSHEKLVDAFAKIKADLQKMAEGNDKAQGSARLIRDAVEIMLTKEQENSTSYNDYQAHVETLLKDQKDTEKKRARDQDALREILDELKQCVVDLKGMTKGSYEEGNGEDSGLGDGVRDLESLLKD